MKSESFEMNAKSKEIIVQNNRGGGGGGVSMKQYIERCVWPHRRYFHFTRGADGSLKERKLGSRSFLPWNKVVILGKRETNVMGPHMINAANVGYTRDVISQKNKKYEDGTVQGWYYVKDVLRHYSKNR